MEDKCGNQSGQDNGTRAETATHGDTAVYYLDLSGRLCWWTDHLGLLTGYSQDELSAMRADDLVATDGNETLTDLIDGAEPGRSWTGELGLLRSDGTTVPCRHEVGIVTDEDDNPVGLVAVATTRTGGTSRVSLGTYRRIIETLGGVVGALGSAGTQAEIERTVCEGLVDSSLYTAAWICHRDRDGSVTPTISAGPETDGEAVSGPLDGVGAYPPAEETFETSEIRVVRGAEEEFPASVREFTTANSVTSVVSVPITSGQMTDRVLVVCSDRREGFDEVETWAFEQLGRVVGFAVNAAHTERIVLSEPVTELEFRLTNTDLPLAGLARSEGVTGQLEWVTRETDGTVVQYFTINGTDAETVVESLTGTDAVVSCTLVGESTANLYEIRLSESLVVELLDAGVKTRDIRIEDASLTIVTTVPRDTDVRNVLQQVRSAYPGVELAAKRTLEDPDGNDGDRRLNDVSLTERQMDALAKAFGEGYFEWPRGATAEEVAEQLDISAATLHYHLRRAERALVKGFLDAEGRRDG